VRARDIQGSVGRELRAQFYIDVGQKKRFICLNGFSSFRKRNLVEIPACTDLVVSAGRSGKKMANKELRRLDQLELRN